MSDTPILDIALAHVRAGVSVVPILPDGSKSPSVKWKQYQQRLPTEAEVRRWFSGSKIVGIAVICGALSQLEGLDFDQPGLFDTWREIVEAEDPHALDGCAIVQSPKGYARHVYMHVLTPEHNQKLAERPDPEPNAKPPTITLIETRGEGGYLLAPGCPPECHPLKQPYCHIAGPTIDEVRAGPPISDERRTLFLSAARALTEVVSKGVEVRVPKLRNERGSGPDTRPGSEFNRTVSWPEILVKHGWTVARCDDARTFWRRPGKDGRAWSATTGYCSTEESGDLLYVFSSNAAPFEPRRAYNKFAAYTHLEYGGDFKAAARSLRGASKPTSKSAARSEDPSTNNRPKPSVMVPGSHVSEGGYEEVNVFEFATQVLDRLPRDAIYRRGEIPGEIVGPAGSRRFVPATTERARLFTDRYTRLCKWTLKKDEVGAETPTCVFVPCSTDHGQLVLARAADHPHVPDLGTITHCPCFAGKAFEALAPGYSATHGIFYDEHPALRGIEPIRDRARIREILTDLLIDFPFQADADQQNFIGLLVAQLVRPGLGGNFPLHLVLSCMERSGKTKLVELVLGRTIQGSSTPALSLSDDEGEREKRILALLLSGTTIVHLDNLPPYLDSRVLSSLITAELFQGRVLGISKLACVRNDLVLVGSGNNVRASAEVAKRCVPIRLLPDTDHPEDRTDFQHPDLPGYLEQVRPQVMGALLGMVRNWVDAGMPRATKPFGGFESFAAVVGGVLQQQGYTEWLQDADLNTGDLERLVSSWRETHADPVTPSELFALAFHLNLYPEILGTDNTHRAQTLFGRRVLLPATQRPVLGMRIVATGSGSSRRYALVPLERAR